MLTWYCSKNFDLKIPSVMKITGLRIAFIGASRMTRRLSRLEVPLVKLKLGKIKPSEVRKRAAFRQIFAVLSVE